MLAWVVRFLEHRVGDRRIIRLVQKWLRAGPLPRSAACGKWQCILLAGPLPA
jgi:hypothetical protein